MLLKGCWCKTKWVFLKGGFYKWRFAGLLLVCALLAASIRGEAEDEPYQKKEILQNKTADNPYVILPFKPNYTVYSYVPEPNAEPYEKLGLPSNGLDNSELEFQLSLHFPLLGDRFHQVFDASFAFTVHAFWQAFNKDISAPFRETNYEPEFRITLKTPKTFLGLTNVSNSLIINHQSNGKTQALSRSWNRIMLDAVFERGNYATSIKPWYRLPEDKKKHPSDSRGDDNPDIEAYLGYFEWFNIYKIHQHTFSFTFLNNCRSDMNRSTVNLTYSVPLFGTLRAYIKAFHGFGRSLIDYDVRQNAFSVGFALSDWL